VSAYKMLADVQLKEGAEGGFVARFATLAPAVDYDGDVTMAGAFPVGKQVPVSAFGHRSWAGALPVGTAVIDSDGRVARAVGRFFTETRDGRDTWLTLKELGGLAQWSYGFEVLEASRAPAELAAYGPSARRILRRLDVHEVSPVLKGAGVDTATESIKCSGCGRPQSEHRVPVVRRPADLAPAGLAAQCEATLALTRITLEATRR
jgi:Caudovirus prohead serine protease